MNQYYVYEWIRLDTNEPFYVGKGRGNRWKKLTRGNNHHFNNIVNSIPIAVNILHDNLTEEIANNFEVWYIREYRDIIGYELCNINDGGEGCALVGKNNPMYGKTLSEKHKKKIGKAISDVWDNKSEMEKKNHREKVSKSLKGRKHSEEHNKKVSENHADFKNKNNPKAKSVICLTTKHIFYTIKEGSEYYNCNASHIAECCKGYRKTCGKLKDGTRLIWKYLIYKHNKKYRII